MLQKILTRICVFIAIRLIYKPLFKIFYRHRVYGLENLPQSGAIIAANHASYFDPPMLGASTYPRLLDYMARDSLFKSTFGGWYLRQSKCHPVHRGKGNSAIFKLIPKLVKKGSLVVVFPEGTRTTDGEIKPGLSGAGLMIRLSNCPVIPTYIHGTFAAWSTHMKKPKLKGRTAVFFGKPLTFEHLAHLDKKIAQKEMVQEIMQAIADLKAKVMQNDYALFPTLS